MASENGRQTQTGGRDATTGHIPGEFALAVGMPKTPGPPGWKWTKLSDVARLETGHTPSRKRPDYWGGEIPWIGIRDATANHGRTVTDTNQHTNQLGIDNSSARVLPANTVCLSRTASVGYVVVMGRPMATSQDFVNWVCSDDLDYRFLKYVLLSENRSFLRFASGTTHQTIYFPEVKAFHICLPPLSEQKAVAEILGGLDAKIELNRRMNETLESLARRLFKSWFVDFDPVRAKMDGRPPPGLSPATAALFPDSLEHASDGELIPRGWDVFPLRGIAELQSGGTPKKSNEAFWNGDIPWISPKVMMSIHAHDSNECVTSDAVGNGTRLIPEGSVRGMGLHQGVRISQARRDVTFNQDVKALVPTAVDGTFLLFALLDASQFLFSKVQASGHGTGVLPTDILQSLDFAVPSADTREKLVEPLKELNDRIAVNSRESETLAALRDTLLPRLLSGELRVAAAAKAVEATT